MDPVQTVGDFMTRNQFVATAGVVAVSGGPDSVCLARVLVDLQGQGQFRKLIVAHLNHQLRGPESDRDEAFVLGLAQNWRLLCRVQRRDVAAEASTAKANLEATARRVRYAWFTQVAREEGASWVATGHTADDQAETVLHRLVRGSGLQGLAGMAARRPLADGIELVRPLLGVRRAAIAAYLHECAVAARQDSSNLDARFTRNRLRHQVLPLLAEQFNPAITDVLCRLAAQAGEVQQEITRAAAQVLATVELPRAGDLIVLDATRLTTAARHLRREVFRLIWARERWPQGGMTFEGWDRLAQMAEEAAGAVDLPGGVRTRRLGRVVQLQKQASRAP